MLNCWYGTWLVGMENKTLETRISKGYYYGLSGVHGLLFVLLAATWRRLPDAIVDFGRELYVPWRLSEGDSLYRDVEYFNGPLSPYLNAAWFELFGASLTTLMIANTVVLVLLTNILYWLLFRVSNVRNSVLATATFLIVFAFSHALRIGNYNYICPYSHEMTHGITFIFVMLLLLTSEFSSSRRIQFLTGIFWGGVFLGKAELFLAASGMLISITVMKSWRSGLPFREGGIRMALFLGGAAMPILLFLGLLASRMEFSTALRGISGTWYWIVNSNVSGGEFYRRLTGLDHPWESVWGVLRSLGSVALAILFAKAFDAWRMERGRIWLATASFTLVLLILLNSGLFPLLLNGPALPLIALAILAVEFVRLVSRFRNGELGSTPAIENGAPNSQQELIIGWAVMSGLLMAKFPLKATVVHYGFVLAMPTVLLAIAWSFERLPKWLCSKTGGATCYAVLCLMLFADVFGNATMSATNLMARKIPVGESSDQLISAPTRGAEFVDQAIRFLRAESDVDDQILVLPEGAMINYQTRRPSPVAYVNLCPPEITMYGEQNILKRLRNSPADYVVLVNKDVTEYGKVCFGAPDYGPELMQWVNSNYVVECVFGNSFSDSKKPGVTVMKQRFKRNMVW